MAAPIRDHAIQYPKREAAVKGFEPIEHAGVEQLRELQLTRLRWSVRHAYDRVEHYRQAFGAAGVHPEDLQSLQDLSLFPFLTKQHFRDHYPLGLMAVPTNELARLHASSGTTGKPTVVGYTARDLDTWARLLARSMYAAGARAGDIVHVAYDYGLFTGGLGAHYGAEKLGCTVVPISGGRTERQVQLIIDFRPTVIMVTPSYLLNIADEFERRGLDPRESSLRLGILGAEPWTDAMRAEIESRFGIDAVNIYGLSEVMGPGVASECVATKDGPAIWEDHFYPEIIDPATGELLPEGNFGELVLTSLTKEALPVIRYRTRDLTRLLPPTSRSMRRMARISGRSDDMLIVRGVNVFPTQIEELLFQVPGLTPHYELELTRTQRLDALTVNVEHLPAVAPDEDMRQRLGQELTALIKAHVGISATVQVRDPGTLARSDGKARRVIDHRKS